MKYLAHEEQISEDVNAEKLLSNTDWGKKLALQTFQQKNIAFLPR